MNIIQTNLLSDEIKQQLEDEFYQIFKNVLARIEAEKTPERKYFTKSEIRKSLKIGDEVLKQLELNGLPYIPIGTKKLIDKDDLYSTLDKLKRRI